MEVFRRACVSSEFRAFAARTAEAATAHAATTPVEATTVEATTAEATTTTAAAADRSSPVTGWLRSLARLAHETPVLAQPSLPLDDPAGLDITPAEITDVRRRLDRDDLTVLAYRFRGDRFCRAQRFAAYAESLGDRFVARTLPDSAARQDVPPFFEQFVASPHSVVTAHLIDEAGQPTIAARDEILAFFAQRLAA
ncbi:hypothetical protein [Streptomyces atratus]|uniref:hypothetical protein n=1 Tax=Streptomyces atratus TaxID=1893 RepID=UPI0033D2324D